jgi:hypothetical protein
LHFAEPLQRDISVAQHQECDTGDEGDGDPENHREDEVKVDILIIEDGSLVIITQLFSQGVDKRKGHIRYQEHDGEDVEQD